VSALQIHDDKDDDDDDCSHFDLSVR